jgi:hypothetical protein
LKQTALLLYQQFPHLWIGLGQSQSKNIQKIIVSVLTKYRYFSCHYPIPQMIWCNYYLDSIYLELEYFWGVGLGFELRGFTLAKQAFYCLSHTSSPCHISVTCNLEMF